MMNIKAMNSRIKIIENFPFDNFNIDLKGKSKRKRVESTLIGIMSSAEYL